MISPNVGLVRANLTPPRGSEIIGQHSDGSPIYRLRKPRTVKVPLEIDGKVQYHRTPTGEPIRPKMTRIQDPENPWEEEVFIIRGERNGMARKVSNFRESPAELQRRAHAERKALGLDALGEALAENPDLDPRELAQAIMANAKKKQKKGQAVGSETGEPVGEEVGVS